jgi:hypothetical protein
MSRLNSLERKRCKWAHFKGVLNQGVKLINEAQNNSKTAGIFRHLPLPLPPSKGALWTNILEVKS